MRFYKMQLGSCLILVFLSLIATSLTLSISTEGDCSLEGSTKCPDGLCCSPGFICQTDSPGAFSLCCDPSTDFECFVKVSPARKESSECQSSSNAIPAGKLHSFIDFTCYLNQLCISYALDLERFLTSQGLRRSTKCVLPSNHTWGWNTYDKLVVQSNGASHDNTWLPGLDIANLDFFNHY